MGRQKRRKSSGIAGNRTATSVLKLLRHHPLPLDELVRMLTRDAALATRVLRAAAVERRAITPDLGTAIVLLGTERLRGLIAGLPRTLRKGKTRKSSKMRALRKTIAADQYRIDPVAIAQAMLRNLERS